MNEILTTENPKVVAWINFINTTARICQFNSPRAFEGVKVFRIGVLLDEENDLFEWFNNGISPDESAIKYKNKYIERYNETKRKKVYINCYEDLEKARNILDGKGRNIFAIFVKNNDYIITYKDEKIDGLELFEE